MNNQRQSSSLLPIIIGGGVVLFAVIIGLIVVLGGSDEGTVVPSTTVPEVTTTSTIPGPAEPDTPPAGDPVEVDARDHVLMTGLIERQYLAISPLDRGEDPLPVVVVLHGMGVSRADMSHVAKWREAVSERKFIAVFPEGTVGTWNAGPCCPPSSLLGADDHGFLDLVYDDMQRQYRVDTDRVFLTGFSNGGVMTYAHACSRTQKFRAIAPLGGSNLLGCTPDSPLPILHIHGNPDPVVPFDGSLALTQILSSEPFPVVPDSVGQWAQANGCNPITQTEPLVDRVQLHTWGDCPDDAPASLIEVAGVEHNWPDVPGFTVLDYLLDFFEI